VNVRVEKNLTVSTKLYRHRYVNQITKSNLENK